MKNHLTSRARRVYCPHFLNAASNLNNEGPYPQPEIHGADCMAVDESAQFLDWHEEQKYKIVCNKDELLAYCMDDVNILRQACNAFRNLFLKLVRRSYLGKQ